MEPITKRRKSKLEIRMGEICPFNSEHFIDRPKEFLDGEKDSSSIGKIAVYRCCIDGQPSPERIIRSFGYSIGILPCSLEFVVNLCP